MPPRYPPRSALRTHHSAVEHPGLREHVLVALDPSTLDAVLAARRRDAPAGRAASARSRLAAAAPWLLGGALVLGACVGAIVGAVS